VVKERKGTGRGKEKHRRKARRKKNGKKNRTYLSRWKENIGR
jgi:hypothetical protein